MAGNANIDAVIATTIQNRSGELADNYTNNNAVWRWLKMNGRVKTLSGGEKVLKEVAYAANTNAQWYSGFDTLGTAQQNGLSAFEFEWKQMACAVPVSGREERQNQGKEQIIDLITAKVDIAKGSLQNLGDTAVFSDGTANGGKEIVGLGAFLVASPSTGTYGGVNRANDAWSRNYAATGLGAASSTTIIGYMNTAYNSTMRGLDHIDLWLAPANVFGQFEAALQPLQRFTSTKLGEAGFDAYQYKGGQVVNDGGIGGNGTANVMYGLNTKYLELGVMSGCNMVPLNPNRAPTNQDGYIKLIGWMGAFTCRGPQFNAYLAFS